MIEIFHLLPCIMVVLVYIQRQHIITKKKVISKVIPAKCMASLLLTKCPISKNILQFRSSWLLNKRRVAKTAYHHQNVSDGGLFLLHFGEQGWTTHPSLTHYPLVFERKQTSIQLPVPSRNFKVAISSSTKWRSCYNKSVTKGFIFDSDPIHFTLNTGTSTGAIINLNCNSGRKCMVIILKYGRLFHQSPKQNGTNISVTILR